MPKVHETEVILLAGLLVKNEDGDVAVERRARITGMTAGIRRELGEKKYQGKPTLQLRYILSKCVVAFGEKKPNTMDFDSLLVGDRDYLILEIMRASGAKQSTVKVQCPACSHSYPKTKEFDDLEGFELQEIGEGPYKVEMDGRKPIRVWEYETPEGDVYRSRFPEVVDLPDEGQSNIYTDLQGLMGRCLHSYQEVDGELTSGPQEAEWFDGFGVLQIDHLADVFAKHAPGLDTVLRETCPECGNEFEVAMEAASFLPETQSVARVGLKKRSLR